MTDQLGSTTITANQDGSFHSELRYKAWGEQRYSSGTTPTNDQFTGQYAQPEIGLDFYNARWYDSSLGRWPQPDTVVQNPYTLQDWDRYANVHNSPVVYNDPTGHDCEAERGWLDEPCGLGGVIPPTTGSGGGISPASDEPNLEGTVSSGTTSEQDNPIDQSSSTITNEPSQLINGKLNHVDQSQKYLDNLPVDQAEFVAIDKTFVNPVTGESFRPDAVNQLTGEVVEFKPISYMNNPTLTKSAQTQAAGYVNQLNEMYGDFRTMEGFPTYYYRIQYYVPNQYIK